VIGGNFEDGFVTGVFSRGFNDHLHSLQEGQKNTYHRRLVNFKEEGEWQTTWAAGDLAAAMMQRSGVPLVLGTGYVLDAADVLSVQTRTVTTGQSTVVDTYVHETLYDTTNPDNWVEVLGFRSEGRFAGSSPLEPLRPYETSIETRLCFTGGMGCTPAW